MIRRYSVAAAAVLSAALLAGCAGLLALALSALTVGRMYGQVRDLLGLDSSDYALVLDGYDMGVSPNPDGALDLGGMPTGAHLFSIVSADSRVGFHRVVDVTADGRLNLGQINLEIGAVISGRVERQAGSGRVPLAGVRVAAVFGGAPLLTEGAGSPLTFPPENSGPLTVMAFTDANGSYRLGPCQFGPWLVTAAYPGLLTDAAFCTVASGVDAGGQNLLLGTAGSASPPATLRGLVTRTGGAAIGQALVNADLRLPLETLMDPDRVTALESQTGVDLMSEPWFRWRSLATQTSAAGAYDFEVPSGTMDVWALKYGLRAKTTEVSLASGAAQQVDFALDPR